MSTPSPLPQGLAALAIETVLLAERRWAQRRSAIDESLDALLWLRAARAAWIGGDAGAARLWYRRATDSLFEIASRAGEPTGSFPYYAELALGAAALSGAPTLSGRIADAVRRHPPPAAGRWWTRGSRGVEVQACAHEVVRALAALLAGAEPQASAFLDSAAASVRALTVETRQRWQASRYAAVAAALRPLLDGDIPALVEALRAFDARLQEARLCPPTFEELVDETFIALVGAARLRDPAALARATFTLIVYPGGRMAGLSRER